MPSFVLISIVLVSTLATLVASVWLGFLPRDGWRRALWTTFALVGASAVFFVMNLSIGIAAILLVRFFTPLFVSIYVLNDVSLVGLSLLQGLVFGVWYRDSRRTETQRGYGPDDP